MSADGSFETVPRIFNFCLKTSPKDTTGKEEKKYRFDKAELGALHGGAPCKQGLNK